MDRTRAGDAYARRRSSSAPTAVSTPQNRTWVAIDTAVELRQQPGPDRVRRPLVRQQGHGEEQGDDQARGRGGDTMPGARCHACGRGHGADPEAHGDQVEQLAVADLETRRNARRQWRIEESGVEDDADEAGGSGEDPESQWRAGAWREQGRGAGEEHGDPAGDEKLPEHEAAALGAARERLRSGERCVVERGLVRNRTVDDALRDDEVEDDRDGRRSKGGDERERGATRSG